MRITCPECGARVAVTPKGRIRKHWVVFGIDRPLAAVSCSASGRDVLEATVRS